MTKIFFIFFILYSFLFLNIFKINNFNNKKSNFFRKVDYNTKWKIRASDIYIENKKQTKQTVITLAEKWNNKTYWMGFI